ncbi:hypothetical protein AVEN_162921-1 [Araneus ventricosus]|uniref:Uncharacterized protein n=1 Tax=Araneus ventricosus TaxID=182803 RepID=A0A4Y2HXK5_ARAVE|nr:hypothetical protein AVEN_162921-1 [Araneus ventricosus]
MNASEFEFLSGYGVEFTRTIGLGRLALDNWPLRRSGRSLVNYDAKHHQHPCRFITPQVRYLMSTYLETGTLYNSKFDSLFRSVLSFSDHFEQAANRSPTGTPIPNYTYFSARLLNGTTTCSDFLQSEGTSTPFPHVSTWVAFQHLWPRNQMDIQRG